MAGYLLSANSLIELCMIEETPSKKWLEGGISPMEIHISVISLAAARAAIEAAAFSAARKSALKLALASRVGALVAGGAIILNFTDREATVWELWIDHEPLDADVDGELLPVNHDTRMVLATAVAHGCALVEPAQPYHNELRNNQVAVISL